MLANPKIGGLDDLCGSKTVPALDVAQQPADRGGLLRNYTVAKQNEDSGSDPKIL